MGTWSKQFCRFIARTGTMSLVFVVALVFTTVQVMWQSLARSTSMLTISALETRDQRGRWVHGQSSSVTIASVDGASLVQVLFR